MWAVLSDIHGNFEALRAVLDDIDSQFVDKLFILGDTIGYGPQPIECLQIALGFATVHLQGDIERAVSENDVHGYSQTLGRHIQWTRQLLADSKNDYWLDFLKSLPPRHQEDATLFVHGSPERPNDFLFPEESYNIRKMTRIFELVSGPVFHGHTHIPGIIRERSHGNAYDFIESTDGGGRFTLGIEKVLIDVGSVGQPRDTDPRACYVLFDGNSVEFRRVPYDVENTIRQIRAIPLLDPFSGERLREGR